LSFAPFFILVSYKGAILDKGFNLLLEDITAGLILRQIAFILGGLISFILSIIFFIKAFFNKGFNFKKRLWLTYLIYIIFASIILSIILSYSIRPMITERYYCYLVPLFITFLSIIFANYKKKIYVVLFLIWIVSMQLNTKIKDTRSFYRFEHQIFNKVQNNKDNYIIIRIMTKYYLDTQKGFENVNIITFPTGEKNELQKNVQNKISEILKNNKNAVIYTTLLKPDKSNPAANYTCFYDKKTDLCLWQIKAKP
ncbi:hypothetical protein IJ531_02410, partial [bacterium]|nr:hypothetical protein [bacterium]